ncbi:M-phase phosphoprotein 9 [Bombina bombina]|uniref:M-phase phosphoprotein 9 n=1 Tax=Bombina bombina TaxID=8345 RepID=UPI00235AA423|nr:M-phase phosphoprotein 9 [Bombina bombina]
MDGSNAEKTTLDLSDRPVVENTPCERSTTSSAKYLLSAGHLISSTHELCNKEQTSTEARKSCEERWLQLFQLIERQCQDQIVAQQEQFNYQMQLIHNEIKHLIKLQGQSCPLWNSCTGETNLTMANRTHPLECRSTVDKDRKAEGARLFPVTDEHDIKQKHFNMQEHFLESTSVSSGYGTHSASEPNACFSSHSQNTLRESMPNMEQTLRESISKTLAHHNVLQESKKTKMHFIKVSDKNCQLPTPRKSAEDVKFTREHKGPHLAFDKNIDRNSNCETSNSKSLTTWAQKLKQNHKKLNQVNPVHAQQIQANSESDSEGKSENKDVSSNAFYLNNRTESANSLMSTGSGFSYWNLEEKDMYHSLPEHLETGLSVVLSTKEVSRSDEKRIPSLTDIYQQKQKESTMYPEWKPLSPSQYTHPPEILTLDPTLHQKMHHSPILSPVNCHNSEDIRVSLTPDSILENAPLTDYDAISVSTIISDSSQLGETPDRSNSPVVARDQWDWASNGSRSDQNYRLTHGDINCDERLLCTEDEANSLSPSSLAPSPLPYAENKPESTSFLPSDYPVMLSNLLTEWKERYQSANSARKSLQECIEDLRVKGKEKENSISRLKSKLREVEEAFKNAFKMSDNKDAQIKQEHKMFQNLLSDYESLGKEHERVKDTLNVTENKLCDAHAEINELKRTISKLESQIKQVEHENMNKLRHIAEGRLWQSSSSDLRALDVAKRKCLTSGTACSIFTGLPLDNKEREMENLPEALYLPDRYSSPPEKDSSYDIIPPKSKRKDSADENSPIMKALKDFEEKEIKTWDTETEKGSAVHRLSCRQTVNFTDSVNPCGSPNKPKDRHGRLNTPPAPRSSSLPPLNRKAATITTPTKRELMLTPLSIKYSPKRSPRENLSPGLSQLLGGEDAVPTRCDIAWGDSSSFKDPSPRKRLQFGSLEDTDGNFALCIKILQYASLEHLKCILLESLEDRLEKINRDLGSIRMTLKKYHVLPSSANI